MVSPREPSHCSILIGAGQQQPRFARHDFRGGDEGTRTPDPLLAKEVLSQLSYIPTTASYPPPRCRSKPGSAKDHRAVTVQQDACSSCQRTDAAALRDPAPVGTGEREDELSGVHAVA